MKFNQWYFDNHDEQEFICWDVQGEDGQYIGLEMNKQGLLELVKFNHPDKWNEMTEWGVSFIEIEKPNLSPRAYRNAVTNLFISGWKR